MGSTPIENMFLNMYLPIAGGNELKVFLSIYKKAYENEDVDLEKIRKFLKMDKEDFYNSIDYWVNEGILKKIKNFDQEEYIEIKSLREAYFGKGEEETKSVGNNKDFSDRTYEMHTKIEQIIDRKLTPEDMIRIMETMDEFGSEPELIVEAFKDAKEKSGNVDPKYVMGFVKSWRDQGILTVKELNENKEKNLARRKSSPRKYYKNKSNIYISESKSSVLSRKESEELRKKRIEQIFKAGNK